MGGKRKLISLIIVIALMITMTGIASASQLTDISSHWAEDQIAKWVSDDLVTGYPDNTFRPGSDITRAEFVVLVNRAYGFSKKAQNSFSDVKSGDWFAAEIQKAQAAGYVNGYNDGTFGPNKKITRQEAATILARLLRLDGSQSDVSKFSDKANIPQWSKNFIGVVAAKGYMGGYPDGTFQPAKSITRAETIATLDRAVGTLIKTAGTFGPEQGIKTITGNVTVNISGVKIKNTVISGDLIFAAGIGDGEAELDNVTVKGTTLVSGGGENSVFINNSTLSGELIVYRVDGKVRVVAKGTTSVNSVSLESSAKLQEDSLTGTGFKDVEILVIKPGEKIELEGDFESVSVETNADVRVTGTSKVANLTVNKDGAGSKIQVDTGASINTLNLKSKVTVSGKGTISKLVANEDANGSKIEQSIADITITGTATLNVNGKDVSNSTSTGGGGSGGGPTVVAVTGVTLNQSSAEINVGDSVTLSASIVPANATNKNIIWETNRAGAATVVNGVVTGVAKGTATITAKSEADPTISATCTVTVKVPVSDVSLSTTTLNLVAGGATGKLFPSITPADADNPNVTWISDDPDVATVDVNGVVTPVAVGITSITVTTVDGAKTASRTVIVGTVSAAVTGITLNHSTYTLNEGANSLVLVPFIAPVYATNTNVTWSTNNAAVATVDNNGRVIAVGKGTAIITATTVDGSKEAECTITVVKPVTGLSLSKDTITEVAVGDADQALSAIIAPVGADNQQVVWTSSNNSIANFIEDGFGSLSGKVRFVAPGTAVITATTVDGGYSADCTVIVGKRVTSVSVSPATGTLKVGGSTLTLISTANPTKATNKLVNWTTSDSGIATVAVDGVVTSGNTAGRVTITATPVFGTVAATPGTSTIDVFDVTNEDMIKDDKLLLGKTVVSVKFSIAGPALPLSSIGVKLNDGTVLQYSSDNGAGVYTFTGSTNTVKAGVTSAIVKLRNTVSFDLSFK